MHSRVVGAVGLVKRPSLIVIRIETGHWWGTRDLLNHNTLHPSTICPQARQLHFVTALRGHGSSATTAWRSEPCKEQE